MHLLALSVIFTDPNDRFPYFFTSSGEIPTQFHMPEAWKRYHFQAPHRQFSCFWKSVYDLELHRPLVKLHRNLQFDTFYDRKAFSFTRISFTIFRSFEIWNINDVMINIIKGVSREKLEIIAHLLSNQKRMVLCSTSYIWVIRWFWMQ